MDFDGAVCAAFVVAAIHAETLQGACADRRGAGNRAPSDGGAAAAGSAGIAEAFAAARAPRPRACGPAHHQSDCATGAGASPANAATRSAKEGIAKRANAAAQRCTADSAGDAAFAGGSAEAAG